MIQKLWVVLECVCKFEIANLVMVRNCTGLLGRGWCGSYGTHVAQKGRICNVFVLYR